MDKLTALRRYWTAYSAAATAHCTSRVAREWMEQGVPADTAAAWASLNYLPAEAAPLIAAGITPATVEEMERHAEQTAGDRDALVAERIRQMVERGEIVDPANVIRVQDPTDPTREIIALRGEDPRHP
ncbi:hypothetical protein [Micromonospora sp. WMMD1082]|uniref:hypothetical protein n=1 Tax=Micromonospora sp. WMMD1082 TaxID=3016104 RepID=UPI0024173CED|nr:hypothetical protein [Micromonospora sp. WMMD1082]MDG4795094.1 hypothetical protein [Micromonospora sp. WMMD1082]